MVNMYDMNLIASLAQQSGSKGGGGKSPMTGNKPAPQPETPKPVEADPFAQPNPLADGTTAQAGEAGATDLAPMGQDKAKLFEGVGNGDKTKQLGLLKSMWA